MIGPTYSVVIPTFRRADLLRRMLPSYLATDPLEVVVVDDGSGPPDDVALRAMAGVEPRVRLVVFTRNRGLPAARNAGVDAASGEWIVFGEDDVWFTPEYCRTLVEHAVRADAAVASGHAPLVDPAMLEGPLQALESVIRAKAMADRPDDSFVGVPWPVERLATGDVVTPLLTAGAAIHRAIFDRVRFDEGFHGNAFREESDFFFSCAEAGIRTIRCPHARCGHMKLHARAIGGGAWAMSRPRYAFQMAANNWRLVRKHEAFIRQARRSSGRSGGAVRIQVEFLASMLTRPRPPSA